MTAAKQGHTKGPWTHSGTHVVAYGDKGANICTVGSPRGLSVVGYKELGFNDPDQDEAYANARLIAAAPELLEALTALQGVQNGSPLVRWQAEWDDAMAKTHAAIAKATGATP